MRLRLAEILLGLALFAVVGWPTVATLRESWDEAASASDVGAGAIDASFSELSSGELWRSSEVARSSAKLVLLTEALALPLGVMLALVLFRTDAWGRTVLLGLIGLSAFVPMPLHATAWIGAFGNAGRMQAFGAPILIVGLPGAAIVHALAALPWVVLLSGVGLRTVEREREEAALLDLPAWQVLFRVTLRRAVGAMLVAGLAVAVLTAGDMTVTDLLQIRTYAEEAYLQFQLGGKPASAAKVALPPFLILGVLLAIAIRALVRSDPARLASAFAESKRWRLGRWRLPVSAVTIAVVGSLLALPLASLVWRAGRVGGKATLGQPPTWSWNGLLGTLDSARLELGLVRPRQWTSLNDVMNVARDSPLVMSVLWSALAATVIVLLAWPLAWLGRDRWSWRVVCVGLIALTLAAPGPVAGMALVLGYRNYAWIDDTAIIVVLAGALRTLPYAWLVLWPAVRGVPPAHLEAAALDGWGSSGLIWHVALPATRGALIAAWCSAFVLSLGELPATNLVAPPGTPPLSVVIWSLLHTGVESHLAGVALIMLCAIALAALLATWSLARLAALSKST
jgi:iron(III) transport system permease protein